MQQETTCDFYQKKEAGMKNRSSTFNERDFIMSLITGDTLCNDTGKKKATNILDTIHNFVGSTVVLADCVSGYIESVFEACSDVWLVVRQEDAQYRDYIFLTFEGFTKEMGINPRDADPENPIKIFTRRLAHVPIGSVEWKSDIVPSVNFNRTDADRKSYLVTCRKNMERLKQAIHGK